MKIIFISCLIMFNLALTGEIPEKTSLSSESAIIRDSGMGFTLTFHAGSIVQGPAKLKYFVICKNGVLFKNTEEIWLDGKCKKKSEVLPKNFLKRYLYLWRKLQKYDIWNLQSPLEILPKIKTPEEDPYEYFETSHSTYEFIFRIGDREHKFEVYYIRGLKDKRYTRVLKEMNKFFEIKGIWE